MGKLLPPADLLEQISGVEKGLRKNQTGGRIAGAGVIASLMQVVVALRLVDGTGESVWVALAGTLVAASAAVLARTRLWLRASSTPIRYTCSIAKFEALQSQQNYDCGQLADVLRFDLADKLNERVGRLYFLEGTPERQPTEGDASQHIHIAGEMLVRQRRRSEVWVDVAPRVRIGPPGEPFKLSHSVCQSLTIAKENSGSTGVTKQDVKPEDYEKILERVYFALASHIYKQIEDDIKRKVGLLPRKYLRATAYLCEADDYANSNTLDGLDHAIHFYRRALALYEPNLRPRPKGWLRRLPVHALRTKSWLARWLRRAGAVAVPKLATKDVRTAAAEVGLANALLHRRTLAGMSGRRANPVYEAPRLTRSAIARLDHFPKDAPGRETALFNAHVSRALAYSQLQNPTLGVRNLKEARSVLPTRYDLDPSYLYVQGLLEELPASSIRFLRLAVERQPRFEVAHFELAVRMEMLWRTRPDLEEKVARVILDAYEDVLKLNPGNVAAAGHAAYVLWLLKEHGDAGCQYERGTDFKQIKPETSIGELDYGMARVALEECATAENPTKSHKDEALSRAYRHYLRGAAAQLLLGVSDWKSTSAQFYFFDMMSDAMIERYDDFYDHAKRLLSCGNPKEERVRRMVESFVANDYGEACYSYYLRTTDVGRCETACEKFLEAIKYNPDAVLPYYNLYLLYMHEGQFDKAGGHLQALQTKEPSWSDALLAGIAYRADAASRAISRKESLEASVFKKLEEVATPAKRSPLLDDMRRLVPHPWFWRKRRFGLLEPIRWGVFRRWRHSVRWEEEFDELHVQAVFKWALARLLYLKDKGASALRLRYSRPAAVLARIERHFWPGNFYLLFTLLQLESPRDRGRGLALFASGRERNSERQACLRALICRWLGETPTSFWALELATSKFVDFSDEQLEVFPLSDQQRLLRRAKEDCDDAACSSIGNWVNQRLKDLAIPEVEGAEAAPAANSDGQ